MAIQPPLGTKDLNPKEVQINQLLTSKLADSYKQWGYEEVSPPNIDTLQTLMADGGIAEKDIVKLIADQPLGLRPEMTASIARAATTRLAKRHRPLRLWASGTVYKSKVDCNGKFNVEEKLQSGVELIGIPSITAEVELLYLLLECLNKLGINQKGQPTLLIGHKSLFNLIMRDIPNVYRASLQKELTNFDLIKIKGSKLDNDIKATILKALRLRGKPNKVISELELLYGENILLNQLKRLFAVIEPIANKHGVNIKLDPTYLSDFDLYTGIIFQLICKNEFIPMVIARGGRYDKLISIFGDLETNESGAGFSISIDNIRELENIYHSGIDSQKRILIAYSKMKTYEDAISKQSYYHSQGLIAMVELEALDSKAEAYELIKKRGFDELEWLE